MIEFILGLVAILFCIGVYALNEKLKKADWVKQDADKAAREILKKHCADVNNPKQVVMASDNKRLGIVQRVRNLFK